MESFISFLLKLSFTFLGMLCIFIAILLLWYIVYIGMWLYNKIPIFKKNVKEF